MYFENLCLGCMVEKGKEQTCPRCGYGEGSAPESLLHLPPGTELQGKYVIGRALGQGGFGITYLAWDKNLKIKLAIKEYLPQQLATRRPGLNEISVIKSSLSGEFRYGLKKFLEEARTLARFIEHPNVVSVRDYFEANNTAYLVMNYHEGVTLQQYLQARGGKIAFEQALEIFMPVLDALKEVHAAGILHRDISPDNLLVNTRGQVVLIDFGAARQAMGEKSGSLSVIMKAGYSPLEQYMSKGRQGPWTDIYAVAATIYRSLTGCMPPESLDRLKEDPLIKPSVLSEDIKLIREQALLKALSVFDEDRYQAVEEFQEALLQGEKFTEQEDRPQEITAEPLPDRETVGADPEPGAKLSPAETIPEQPAQEAGSAGKEKLTPAGREAASTAPVKEQEKKFSLTGSKKLALLAAAVLVGGILLYGGVSFLVASPEETMPEELLVDEVIEPGDPDGDQVEEAESAGPDQDADEPGIEEEQIYTPETIAAAAETTYRIDYDSGALPLADLPVGARVFDPSWEWEFRMGVNYSNYDTHGNPTDPGEVKPVTWIVVAKNHYDIGVDHVTLLSEDLIGFHAFDDSTDRSPWLGGSNHWGESGTTDASRGLRPWLNSNGIHTGEGLYHAFSENFKRSVVTTSVPNREWREGVFYETMDEVFIPSTTELGDNKHERTYQIGDSYPYFKKAADSRRNATIGGIGGWYWTRSAVRNLDWSLRKISSGGGFAHLSHRAFNGGIGVRPVVNVKSEVMVSENGD